MKMTYRDYDLVLKNKVCHDSVAHLYANLHSDIFNPIEQNRLRQALALMGSYLQPKAEVLDFGCGSGNLTRHLIELGYAVTSADISEEFLNIVSSKFNNYENHRTLLLSGNPDVDLNGFRYDAICIYSVLHHLPDYIYSIRRLTDFLKPGGVLYIDHEASPSYWTIQTQYSELQRRSRFRKIVTNFDKFFSFRWYKNKVQMLMDPRFQSEGDIHVWPEDHIEWDVIDLELSKSGFLKLFSEDYLVYQNHYKLIDYEYFREKVSDMRVAFYQATQSD